MKNIWIVTLMVLVSGYLIGSASAQSTAKSGRSAIEASTCGTCGMNLAPYTHSRMQITFTDGTRMDVCSLHCAKLEMTQHKDKPAQSLKVADYSTGTLIDARSATWVVGGTVNGGMNSPAVWAFARGEDAEKFIQQNGGKVTAYDAVLTSAEPDSHQAGAGLHGHEACLSAPGSQLTFNPALGDDIYHTHPVGCGMVSYKYMRMNMDGLRDGTSDIGLDDIGFMRGSRYDYMMIPTSMTMDMHMLMLMYGITDRFTMMGMANYQKNDMEMLMDMGPMRPIAREPTMSTEGLGDTELRGIYQIDKRCVGSLGLSLPTGDIEQTVPMMGWEFRAPYDMQLGSGSYDLKPAFTYSDFSADALWNWGGQAMYTWHTAENDNNYRLGDSVKLNGWLQRAFGPAATWLRLAYNHTDSIHGQDPEIQKLLYHSDPTMPMKWAPMPDADPDNYGGDRLDGAIGLSYRMGPASIGVEGGIPLYQDLNGPQMKVDWFITAGAQIMF